ncbi:MAG: cell division protein ZapE [Pseudohongiellaceae bacterium]
MTPEQQYRRDIERGELSPDAAQARAMAALQAVYDAVLAQPQPRWWHRFPFLAPGTVTGLYLYGGVGRGKTYLMDTFHESLPLEQKLRTHFHRFMQGVHHDLTRLGGRSDPLEAVADSLAARARVICFDEFFVSDIGDAMILGGLLEALFRRRVVLVATSNVQPDRLYENGLQRERFLPAITALQRHTRVLHLDSDTDYRLRELKQAGLYHWPADQKAEEALASRFERLAPIHAQRPEGGSVEVLGRRIPVRRLADDVAWFDFEALCGGPRSANDYIELAREFHTVLLSGVPCMDERNDDRARRFVNLVDELYDRRVKLIVSAACPMQELYRGRELAFVFERTVSRLREMQSEDYLGSEHRA